MSARGGVAEDMAKFIQNYTLYYTILYYIIIILYYYTIHQLSKFISVDEQWEE